MNLVNEVELMRTGRSLGAWMLVVALLVGAYSISEAVPPAGERPVSGPGAKRITAAIQGDPSTLSRNINSAGAGRARGVPELEQLINAGLTVPDEHGIRIPQLADDVPSVEAGSWRLLPGGRMETTWRIKPGAAWHDGTPLTTDDLTFTIQVGQDRELAMISHPAYALVDRVEVSDPRTITVGWSAPFTNADALFSRDVSFPLPRHLLEPSYRQDASSFIDLPYWTSEYVGTGPFRLREYVRGSRLILDANEGYVLGTPHIATIEVRFISDLSVFVANLLSGEVEMAIGRSLSLDQGMTLRERWSDGVVLVAPGAAWTAMFPQHTNPTPAVLGDVRFRRALLQAIDRQQLVDVLLHGLVPVAESLVSPSQPEFEAVQPYIVRYPYDPARAAVSVEELGFVRGPDGGFRDAGGGALAVEVRSTGGDDFRDKMLLALADSWKQIGIDGQPVIIPRQRANDREYRVTRPAFELVSQPTDLRGFMRFHSSEMPTVENAYRGDNRLRYANADLDALLDRLVVTLPSTERAQLLGQIVHHLTEHLVTLDVHFNGDVVAYHKRIRNVLPGDPWNAQAWDVS